MTTIRTQEMGIVTTTIIVSNLVNEILAERGFIQNDQIRSITLNNVLVDIGATRLCLPADIITVKY
ncbi:MAG: hypothetical protein KME21_00455 [Desmonostoc vinosum HA7617-LM4]|jgi:hypothetical protein|nr:hypothetical protein [Desmonostoc vinosum HA7617-LM4]